MGVSAALTSKLTAALTGNLNGSSVTFAQLEALAVAAAAAASGLLFYVKSDLSSVFSDSGTTKLTAVGQSCQQITQVGGSSYFRQTTAGNKPLLAAAANGCYALDFDGVDDFMLEDTQYFTAAETPGGNTYVIAGVLSDASSAARVIYHSGTANANPRFPYLALTAADVANASWRGDDTTNRQVTGATTGDAVPLVLTASKTTDAKTLYVNGVSEGTPNNTAMGSLASVSRARLGIANDTTNPFAGLIGLIYLAKTMTTQQQKDIERFAAFIVGATYLG